MQPKESKYVTIPELAKMLGLSRVAVFKKVKKGEIKAIKIGRTYAISKKDLGSFWGRFWPKMKRKRLTAR